MNDTLKWFAADQEWSAATRDRLVVTVWRKGIALECVRKMERAIESIVRGPAGPEYASLAVVEPSVSLKMSPDVREALGALQTRIGSHARCRGYLVAGTGFVPATVRSVTAGLALVSRSNAPSRIFAEPGPLAEWIAPYCEIDAREVARVLELARSATSMP